VEGLGIVAKFEVWRTQMKSVEKKLGVVVAVVAVVDGGI
jgi:hypothetical protein